MAYCFLSRIWTMPQHNHVHWSTIQTAAAGQCATLPPLEGNHLRFRIGLLLLTSAVFAAEKVSAPELIRMSQSKSSAFRQALVASLGNEPIKKGTAFLGEGLDFVWAVEAAS